MDSARPSNPKNLLTLKEAARKLSVSVETLLTWNEQHILKPTITSEGEIGYTEEQLNQFLKVKDTLAGALSHNDKPAHEEEEQPGRAAVSLEESPTPPVVPSRKGIYQKFIHWIGEGFYQDEYIKDYIRSQVKQSLSLSLSRFLPKRL